MPSALAAQPSESDLDLFYDPNLDDEDEKWVSAMRRRLEGHKGVNELDEQVTEPSPKQGDKGQGSQKKVIGSSDAVLNCPACMVTLSLDCQR